MLSTHAATAVENGRLFESEQKRRQEAENLRHAATVISSTLDLNNLLEEILKALKQVIYYDHASVFLLEGEWLRLVTCHGFPNSEGLINQKFPADDLLFRQLCDGMQPIIIKDVQQDSRFKNWGDTYKVHGWMGVPLVSRGRVIGYITLDNFLPAAYNDTFTETAMAFANQAATGIENARLFQEQTRRAHIIQALADIANEIATTREVMPVLDQITQRALDMLNANHVAIYLLQDDNVTLKTVSAHGIYRNKILSHTRKVGEGITGTIFLNGKPEIIKDTQEDPRRVTIPGTREREEKLESLMSSPLILRGKPIGVINAWRQKENGLFNESELSFLVGIAHQVSICIESGRLFQETSRQAQEAAAIAEVGRDISATLQLDVVLERIASYAMDLLHSETSAVYLAEGDHLRAIAAFGADSEAIKNDPLPIGAGILGNIALQTIGEIVNNTANDPRAIIVKGTEKNPNENLMGVPILLKNKHTGLLAVWRTGEGTDFKEPDLEFLTSLARQAAVAIENARLYDEKEHRVKELEIANRRLTTLRNIDAAIASSFDLRLTLNILMDQTVNHLNVDAVDIGLYHPDIQSLTYLASTGFQTASPTRPQVRLGDGLAGQVILRQSALQVTDLQNASEVRNDPLIRREGFVAYIGIPLIVKGQIKGVFEVFQRTPLSPDRDWMEFLHTLAGQAAIAIDSSQLFEKLQRSNQELIQAYDKTLEGWARALEIRDSETEGHSRRVTEMTIRLAQFMGLHENELINIYRGVLLHDIGKIGVPDNILRKTGSLTDHEWNEMRKHPTYAKELLKDISYLKGAVDIPYCHHEHWDGNGYPQGLKGEQIPLPARIFSVVDIWDALLSDRPYRKAWPREKVIQYLKDVAGTILDPKIVEIFLNMVDKETG
jgi:response regulator RpfG family c-di-GMP phosphodiesterase